MLFSLRKVPWTDCLHGLELCSLALRHDEYYVKKHPPGELVDPSGRQGNLWGNILSIDSEPPRTESHQYKKVQTDNAVDLKRERAKAAGVTGIFTLSAQAKLSYPKCVATGQHYHKDNWKTYFGLYVTDHTWWLKLSWERRENKAILRTGTIGHAMSIS